MCMVLDEPSEAQSASMTMAPAGVRLKTNFEHSLLTSAMPTASPVSQCWLVVATPPFSLTEVTQKPGFIFGRSAWVMTTSPAAPGFEQPASTTSARQTTARARVIAFLIGSAHRGSILPDFSRGEKEGPTAPRAVGG